MGGSSKSTTVGFWYKLLAHYGLSKGPIDAFLELRGGDRTAWKGFLPQSGRIFVNKPNLWGGEASEGGLDGYMDLMFGEADQLANDYLVDNLGENQPTYRGKCTALWRGGRYGAMNPYPKPLSFKIRRILKGWDSDECWYPETAAITLIPYPKVSLYFALDYSLSMDASTPDGSTRLEHLKSAMEIALQTIATYITDGASSVDIMVVAWHGSRASITRRNCSITDINDIISWVKTQTTVYGTDFEEAVQELPDFMNSSSATAKKLAFFVTDGEPVKDGSSAEEIAQAAADITTGVMDVSIYGVNIALEDTQFTEFIDNTPGDGVPVVSDDNISLISNIILSALAKLSGMNPAHILYDTICSHDMQAEPKALINEDSFRAAADKLYDEKFGLCTTFEDEDIEEFQQRICNVIGAALTQSRVDGKYYLDLIRGDYVLEDLPVVTGDDIIDFSQEPSNLTETINEIRIEWFDPEVKVERTTPPIQALGSIQAAGGVISETRSYPELAIESLAIKAGMRDLAAGNTPLSRFNITVNRRFASLRPATYFRLQYPEVGIVDMVCIIGDIEDSAGLKGNIKLVAIQDVFSFPDTVFVEEESGLATEEDTSPTTPPAVRVIEVPYVELVAVLSNADLAALPDESGFFMSMAARPTNGLNYKLYSSIDGTEYDATGNFDWTPTCLAAEQVGYIDSVISITAGTDLSLVEVGTWGTWDDEIFRVDDIDIEGGILTIGRGCADSTPAKHAPGSRLWFCGEWAGTDTKEYVSGEEAWFKLAARTGSEEQPLSAVSAISKIQSERQFRPYPPGGLEVNSAAYPNYLTGTLTLSWSDRDRLLGSDQLIDTTAGNTGPEPGTTYTLRLYGEDGLLGRTETGLTSAGYTYTDAVEREDFQIFDGSASAIELSKLRALWSLDEGSGTLVSDSHSGDFDGSLSNDAAWDASGPFGSSLKGGSDHIVNLGAAENFLSIVDDVEVFAWVYIDSTSSDPLWILQNGTVFGPGSRYGFSYLINVDMKVNFTVRPNHDGSDYGSSSGRWLSTVSVPTDQWVMVFMSRTDTDAEIEIHHSGGVISESLSLGGDYPITSWQSGAVNSLLAYDNGTTLYPSDVGRSLSQVGVYAGRLTSAQRATLYASGSGLPYPFGTGGYRLNQNLRLELEAVRDGYESFQYHDVLLTRINILDRDLVDPPVSASVGDQYIPAATATGDWVGHEGDVAEWTGSEWAFYAPLDGWQAWVEDEGRHVEYSLVNDDWL